jgi:hypothetical protein
LQPAETGYFGVLLAHDWRTSDRLKSILIWLLIVRLPFGS